MDEFNAPLGLDREKPKSPATFSATKVIGSFSLLLVGVVAAWFYILGNQNITVGSNPSPVEPKSVVTTPAASLRETSQKATKTYTESDPDKPGRLEEFQPSGALVEPKITFLHPTSSGPSRLINQPDPSIIEKSAFGQIPKISSSGERPMDIYARKIAPTASIRIAIVIGGLGLSQSGSKSAIERLPADVTLAFAPYGNSIRRWMQKARNDGHELLMQVPMEPIGYPQINPGKNTLHTATTPEENIKSLHWTMGRMTNYVGMMNYLGAKLNADPDALYAPLSEIANRGLLYLDDGSAFSSTAGKVAKQVSLPFVQGNIIIDDGRTARDIDKNLAALEKLARRNGKAVGIASAFPLSVRQITSWIKKARKRGIEFVPISSFAR